MSATGRSERGGDGADYFPTPDWAIRRLLEAHPLQQGYWLEPCAGDGQIIRTVNAVRGFEQVKWDAIELQEKYRPHLEHPIVKRLFIGDFVQAAGHMRNGPKYDVIMTNPPYLTALEFIWESLSLAHNVVMLLRLNFLATVKRAKFMHGFMPDVYVLPDRPSFTDGSSTDATEYAWMVWTGGGGQSCGRIQVLNETPIEEKKAWKAELARRQVYFVGAGE